MGIEISIVCDSCSSILVAASNVGKARREGRRNKSVVSFNKKDLCPKCYKQYRKGIEQALASYVSKSSITTEMRND